MAYTVKPTTGPILSHVQAMYRPGDRQAAIDLFKAIDCAVYDTGAPDEAGSTIISVHPDNTERSPDNVFFLCQMPPEQVQLDAVVRSRVETDDELRAARDAYRGAATDRPFGLFHFAVRYPTFADLERVLAGIEDKLTPELKSRVTVKIFRPGDPGEVRTSHFQSFIYTDVIATGVSAFGEIFELGAFG